MTQEDQISRRHSLLRLCGWAGAGIALANGMGCESSRTRAGKPNLVGTPLPGDPAHVRTSPTAPATQTGWGGTTTAAGSSGPIEPRSAWAKFGPNRAEAYAMNGIRRITVHHDAIPSHDITSRAAAASRMEAIRRGHVAQGWADIGYHYVVDPQGRVWEGRSVSLQGAHVKDQNPNNLGIMVMGNFEQQRPTPQASESLRRLLAGEIRRYRLSERDVFTHRELASTACPGANLQSVMHHLRSNSSMLRNA